MRIDIFMRIFKSSFFFYLFFIPVSLSAWAYRDEILDGALDSENLPLVLEEMKKFSMDELMAMKNKKGCTILHLAANKGWVDIVRYFMNSPFYCEYDLGTDCFIGTPYVILKDQGGWTALDHAALKGQTEVVRVLLEHPEYLSERAVNSWSVLFRAAYKGHSELVEFLMRDYSYFINHIDQFGMTALHFAVLGGSQEVARLLFSFRPDLASVETTQPMILRNKEFPPGLTAFGLAQILNSTKLSELMYLAPTERK